MTKKQNDRLFSEVISRHKSRSSGRFYEVLISRLTGTVYCTCPSWKFQRKKADDRTCRHIAASLGI